MAKEENKVVKEQAEEMNPKGNPLDDALKQAKEIVALATKKAEEIIAKAEKTAGNSEVAAKLPYDKRPEILAEIKRGEDSVDAYLFSDNDKYKDDVYVSIGGSNILIKRGVSVKIPRKYDAIIKQAQKQNNVATAYVDSLAGKNIEIKG